MGVIAQPDVVLFGRRLAADQAFVWLAAGTVLTIALASYLEEFIIKSLPHYDFFFTMAFFELAGLWRREPRHHPPSRRRGACIAGRRRGIPQGPGGRSCDHPPPAEVERRGVVEARASRRALSPLRHRRDVPGAVREFR
jgi:hypothetical protein